MISTITKKIIECEKGCEINVNSNGIIPYICGKTRVYNCPKDESSKIFLCPSCQAKLTAKKEDLKLAEETKEKLKEETHKIWMKSIEDSNARFYIGLMEKEIEKTFGGTKE